MGCNVLIVAPPTIDLIWLPGLESHVTMPGGPGLYGGFAALRQGCSADLVGPIGWHTLETVILERALGLDRLGYFDVFEGYVFEHAYDGEGNRRTILVSKPIGLDLPRVVRVIGRMGYDVALVSPVYGEDLGLTASYLYYNGVARVVAFDLQGVIRVGLPAESILWHGASLIHVSRDDVESPPRMRPSLLVYTMGVEGGILIGRGVRAEIPPPRELVKNPTGAGDIFTILLSIRLSQGYTLEEAVETASRLTPEILKDTSSIIEPLDV